MIADHWQIHTLIEHLHKIDDRILADFKKKRGRPAEHADRIKKMIEEIGEVMDAHSDRSVDAVKHRTHLAEEVWDSAIVSLAQGFLLGLNNEEMMKGLNDCLEKLQYRWIPQGFSQ
jgi:NTP pyrophosphatase (non-canonical NTP hydrolase)